MALYKMAKSKIHDKSCLISTRKAYFICLFIYISYRRPIQDYPSVDKLNSRCKIYLLQNSSVNLIAIFQKNDNTTGRFANVHLSNYCTLYLFLHTITHLNIKLKVWYWNDFQELISSGECESLNYIPVHRLIVQVAVKELMLNWFLTIKKL